jgi:hypothetical protein
MIYRSLSILLMSASLTVGLNSPVHAQMLAKDPVRILNHDTGERYTKPWGQLKLNLATQKALLTKIFTLRQTYYDIPLKIQHLFLAHNDVTRVSFMSEDGWVIMMDWPTGEMCSLMFDSQGGFAGLLQKSCQVNTGPEMTPR